MYNIWVSICLYVLESKLFDTGIWVFDFPTRERTSSPILGKTQEKREKEEENKFSPWPNRGHLLRKGTMVGWAAKQGPFMESLGLVLINDKNLDFNEYIGSWIYTYIIYVNYLKFKDVFGSYIKISLKIYKMMI